MMDSLLATPSGSYLSNQLITKIAIFIGYKSAPVSIEHLRSGKPRGGTHCGVTTFSQ